MKILKAFILFVMITFTLTSCATTKAPDNIDFSESVQEKDPPPLLTELPVIEYTGAGIKYELESMLLKDFVVMYDSTASGEFCTRLMSEGSTAELKVRFPAGTYECLLCEKAFDTDKSAFYLYIDETPYRIYPSNPPLGCWELTTRTPVYIYLDEPRTIHITIKANSPKRLGDTGMCIDYIQFVKRD